MKLDDALAASIVSAATNDDVVYCKDGSVWRMVVSGYEKLDVMLPNRLFESAKWNPILQMKNDVERPRC